MHRLMSVRRQLGPRSDVGTAGASARREHARRKDSRERRVRDKHPLLGGLLLSLTGEPQHERAWARGAAGEEQVARVLSERCDDTVVLLHDRKVPSTRANIDHVAVARSGVWVIDAKRYRGTVRVRRPLLGKPKLTIDGRDKTTLIVGLAKQVALVRAAVNGIEAGVPVHGALCFVDADLPLLGTLSLDGFSLIYPRRLARRINADGPLQPGRIQPLAAVLAHRFPQA